MVEPRGQGAGPTVAAEQHCVGSGHEAGVVGHGHRVHTLVPREALRLRECEVVAGAYRVQVLVPVQPPQQLLGVTGGTRRVRDGHGPDGTLEQVGRNALRLAGGVECVLARRVVGVEEDVAHRVITQPP